ncbi:MAG: phenylalanine--tRNA ligase subunit beta [Gammaproteobacteria bacterium]|nr:MAG: phenylalanine--tRNA ligase subunit beta [Gammaproteobacteria bacterium]
MQVSIAWLNEWLEKPVAADALAAQLTMAGLEVDAVVPAAGAFSGVVVGEILSCDKHPEADRLRVCQVSDGEKTLQVVCGAPNAAAGLKVPFATVGAVLPGDKKIGQAKLRGVESFGMLCGASELGIDVEGDGLFVLPADAPVGENLRAYLQLDDTLLELDLTPNRGDCLGMRGLAREVAALNDMALCEPAIPAVPATIDAVPAIRLESAACPRYAGRLIRGVNAKAPSPLWMQERLRRAGIRSIDAIVDVTNYIMLELGQPMHAFDVAKLEGGVCARMARKDERLVLLDGSEKTLSADTLVIADDNKALAIAGVMGGEHSGVSEATQDILLESAFFDAIALAGKARQYGLHTDSSHRFERGVDPQGQCRAIERATRLLLDIVGGQAGPVVLVESAAVPADVTVGLRHDTITRVLGVTLPHTEVAAVLERLGCQLSATGEGWQVAVPSWRFDIRREVDLVEEVARVYGYNRLPVAAPRYAMQLKPQSETRVSEDRYRDCLVDRGYREAITYSFVDPAFQQRLLGRPAAVMVQNPIASDMAAMRLSLWPGLLKAVLGNLHRQQQRVRLFEIGLVFEGQEADQQPRRIAGVACGLAQEPHWGGKGRPVDFFDAKGDVEALLALSGAGRDIRFEAAVNPSLHPGQSACIRVDGQVVGWVGALHPQLQQQLELTGATYLFELSLNPSGSGKLPSFKNLSRFPETRRDLALVLDSTVPAQAVADAMRELAGEHLKALDVFDQFTGAELGENKKSLGFAMVFQHPERTLTDEEITSVMDRIMQGMSDRFGAIVRT